MISFTVIRRGRRSPATVDDGVPSCASLVKQQPRSLGRSRRLAFGQALSFAAALPAVAFQATKNPTKLIANGGARRGPDYRTCRVASGHHRTSRAPPRGEAWIWPSRIFSRESRAGRRLARDDRRHDDAVGDPGLRRRRPRHRFQCRVHGPRPLLVSNKPVRATGAGAAL